MIIVRKALPSDTSTIVRLLEKKAAFDRALNFSDDPLGTTPERIAKALFGSPMFAHALISISEEVPVGLVFYYYRFSSFQARPSLWLDDLFVDVDARRAGTGLALMSALAEEASAHDCTHIAWTAHAENPSGIPFYTKVGATIVSQQGSKLGYSITPEFLVNRIAGIRMLNR